MNTEQVKFLLNWNRFNDHLSSCMNKLMTDSSYSDIIIATADKQMIYSHRFVLANSSKYFQRLFKGINTHRGIQLVVALPDIKYDIFKILMNYMYKGVTQVPHELLPSVIRAGQFLEINGLMNFSENENNGNKQLSPFKPGTVPQEPPPQQKCATVHPSTRKPSVGKESNKLFGPIPPNLLNRIHSRENAGVAPMNSLQIDDVPKKPVDSDNHSEESVVVLDNGKENQSKASSKSSKNKPAPEEKNDVIQLPLKRKTYSKEPVKKVPPIIISKSSSSSSASSSSSVVIESPLPKKRRDYIIGTEDTYEEIVITTEKKDDESTAAEKENHEVQEIQEILEKNCKKVEAQEPQKSQETHRSQEAQRSGGRNVNVYTELKCEYCHKCFSKPTDWVKHMANRHADKGFKNFRDVHKGVESSPVTCAECSCVCYTIEEWSRHLSRSGCCQPKKKQKRHYKNK